MVHQFLSFDANFTNMTLHKKFPFLIEHIPWNVNSSTSTHCSSCLFEFLFSWQNNISTDWEPKNTAENPVQLAPTFFLFFFSATPWLFSAALKLLLGFSQQLQNAQKFKCSRHLAGAWHLSGSLFLNPYDFKKFNVSGIWRLI